MKARKLSPTKNWKQILLTRTCWPKNFCVDGEAKLPKGCKFSNQCVDGTTRWVWELYRMTGGSEYYVAIWPENQFPIGPPYGGYVRLAVKEAYQFSILQCLSGDILTDWHKLKKRRK